VISLTKTALRVLIIVSLKTKETEKIEKIISKYPNTWLLTDSKSADLLAKSNVLSQISSERIIVFNGRKPEEFTLKIYSAVAPDIVYLCDERGSLKPISDFMTRAPVDIIEC
jgi:Uma2 family endonuclease